MKRADEISLIESCVFKSAQIIEMKKAKQSVMQAKTEVLKCTPVFPHEPCLLNLINDIDNRIYEYKLHISKLLTPLLSSHGILIDQVYWFSELEIRQGFSIFQRSSATSNDTCVLFLRDIIDPITNRMYPTGYIFDRDKIKDSSMFEMETNIITQQMLTLKECLKLWYK